ncbi:DUF6602 domain-containing protein [Lacinutrix sp. MedPE-SW]|uniref:DUF6602 domain-containing protein n=1 Tax=Lacinutrix sp. MedPE-SW TaxID=1860087 RepID=UPI000912C40F|nr:DUF6602 domain-containing protein [Lacinutrix sp. MedPE-SW]OIQ21200.1 MAG: hypothetical protein BM549_09500 [Lacinutrix sp. MedPE-SW]
MSKVDLQTLFAGLQNQMVAQLNTSRANITHQGAKGDALENAWIEWLKKYLPNRYSVDKAIVIDSEGNTSHQIDIVIYDNWFTPFIFSQNGFHYIPAEGVYAVFEVKPDIQGHVDEKSFIEYSAEKIESVRQLKRTSTDMINSGRKFPPRPLTKIVGGILTSTNTFSHNNDNKTIKAHLANQKELRSIDMGCIADYGCFVVDYEPNEEIMETGIDKFIEHYQNRNIKSINFSKTENSLVTFFLQLTRYLQQAIGTIAAIDLNSYLSTIGETLDEEI